MQHFSWQYDYDKINEVNMLSETAEDQYFKRLVDIRLSRGNPAIVHDRGRNADRDTVTAWTMKILKVKRASDHSEHETGLLMVSVFGTVGLIMWFNTHFTGVWSTAQRIIQRFKLIPARPAQNQPRAAFMKQSGTFWPTQNRDRIRGWQHCREMPSQWRIHAMQVKFGQNGTLI